MFLDLMVDSQRSSGLGKSYKFEIESPLVEVKEINIQGQGHRIKV